MAPEFERYDYSHLVDTSAPERSRDFDATRFDELLTDDDRKLLERDFHISWWAYSDLSMRPLSGQPTSEPRV